MTTVAYRNGVMAADTQATGENLKWRFGKLRKVHGDLVGVSGDVDAALVFLDWYENRNDDVLSDIPTSQDFEIMVVHPNGDIYLYTKVIQPLLIQDRFYAVGSGSGIAMGAMEMGASAKRAVKIARKHDSSTGGKVETIRL